MKKASFSVYLGIALIVFGFCSIGYIGFFLSDITIRFCIMFAFVVSGLCCIALPKFIQSQKRIKKLKKANRKAHLRKKAKSGLIAYNKEEFDRRIKCFIDAGLFTEIFSTKKISLFNACNAIYIVSGTSMFNKEDSNLLAFAVTPKYIKAIVLHEHKTFMWLLEECEKGEVNIGVLDEETYDYFVGVKAKTDEKGPYIDLDYEKEIVELSRNKILRYKNKIKIWFLGVLRALLKVILALLPAIITILVVLLLKSIL